MSTLVFGEYGMVKVGAPPISDSELDIVLKSTKKEPMVELTIEEAKELQRGLSEGTISTIYLWIDKNASKFSRLLKERIEKAKV